jgi:hypothetical protein
MVEPTKPTQQHAQQKYQGMKVVSSRKAREGDPGYQLSTVDEQIMITLEDGTEKVVKPSELTT